MVDVRSSARAALRPLPPTDKFSYAPVVDSISPATGSAEGDTAVTLTGINFTGATAVDFGTNSADFTFDSDTEITAAAPAGTGVVDVTVVGPGGTSATSATDKFSYVPDVTGVSPTDGPATGNTSVTISGAGFTAATAVDFGTTPAINYTVTSDNQITATAPVGTGVVNVTVTGPGGTSPTSTPPTSSATRRW